MSHPHTRLSVLLLLLIGLLTACTPGGSNPPPGPSASLAITTPTENQTLSGTIALAATGQGGTPTNLLFTLAGQNITAAPDNTAGINTRNIPDGSYTLQANATIGGKQVTDSIPVTIQNTLPTNGTVGSNGGALASDSGSIALIPPGAINNNVTLSVSDLSQQEIKNRYAVDYEALGVTFLGALELTAQGTDQANLPLQVDLNGWSEGVNVDHQVLMFTLAPDADGDGVGELMMAADAQAIGDSVITRPVPTTQAYGFGTSTSTLHLQQNTTARPGQIITLSARGLIPGGQLSNTATIDGNTQLLARAILAEATPYNPLMDVQLAVPALGQGNHTLTLHNRSTGYRSQPLELDIATLGTGTQTTWNAFTTQLQTALDGLTNSRTELKQLAQPWLDQLTASTDPTARAMSTNSGLVTSTNQSLLANITQNSYTSAQNALVSQHALLLDAIAASVPALTQPANNLATLLLTARAIDGGAVPVTSNLTPQQGNTGGCSSPGSQIFGPTGMGSAPPPGGSGCGSGSGNGSGNGGNANHLAPQQAPTFGPIQGAIVRIFRQDSSDKLSPFTQLTDQAGYYYIPFIPEGEPFTVNAIHPPTGATATANGTGLPYGQTTSIPLVFTQATTEGAPTASFTVTETDTATFAFDGSASSDPDGTIVEYVWDFGDGTVETTSVPTTSHAYVQAGVFTSSLSVLDDEGKAGATSRQVTVAQFNDLEIISLSLGGLAAYEACCGYNPTSTDGRYVAFYAYGPDLTDGGNWPDDEDRIYRRDMVTGQIDLVDVGPAGAYTEESNADDSPDISADGRYVVFASSASDLVPDDTNGSLDIFRKDMETGAVFRASLAPGGGQLTTQARQGTVSGDGQRVVYTAAQWGPNITTNQQILLHDLATGEIRWITQASGNGGSGASEHPLISSDGSVAVFQSYASDLVPDDTNGNRDLFAYDVASGQLQRVNVTDTQSEGPVADRFAVSDDGRYVAFASPAPDLVPAGDDLATWEIFVKDLRTGELRLVSNDADGNRASFAEYPAISGDGRYVAYTARYEPSGQPQGFVKDLNTGAIARFDLTESGLEPDDDPEYIYLSSDGRYLTFSSCADNYVPNLPNCDQAYRVKNPLWEEGP